MTNANAPAVILAAGTCTGAGTSVALVVACQTLSEQVASGRIESAEVHIPRGANEARAAAVGLTVREQTRVAAIVEELFGRHRAGTYIGFADRLPLMGRSAGSTIMVVQNPHLYEPSNAPSIGGLARTALTWWAKRSATTADLIICATNASSDALVRAIPTVDRTRIEVRLIRPQTPPARTGLSPEIRRVLLLGDLYAYKRFDVALDGIRTWAESTGVAREVEVIHCGAVQDREATEAFEEAIRRASSAGLAVSVRGSVSHDEAMEELARADLLVSASEVETQGLTILEALAVGVPVVARAIGPVESVAGDAYQRFAQDGGGEEVAEAIGAIVALDARERLVERGLGKADIGVGWDLLPVGLSSAT